MKRALLALVLFACSNRNADSPPTRDEATKGRADSKIQIATLDTKKFAFEAYPQWSSAHPSKACPEKLGDLVEYADAAGLEDPWGQPYRMYCGSSLPAGAKGGLAVMSLGEDGKEGTPDDIKSWE